MTLDLFFFNAQVAEVCMFDDIGIKRGFIPPMPISTSCSCTEREDYLRLG